MAKKCFFQVRLFHFCTCWQSLPGLHAGHLPCRSLSPLLLSCCSAWGCFLAISEKTHRCINLVPRGIFCALASHQAKSPIEAAQSNSPIGQTEVSMEHAIRNRKNPNLEIHRTVQTKNQDEPTLRRRGGGRVWAGGGQSQKSCYLFDQMLVQSLVRV